MTRDAQQIAARVEAVLDLALTTPVKARRITDRWEPSTAIAYVSAWKAARVWWETQRATARAAARDAGVEVPAAAPAFMPWPPDRLAEYVAYLVQQGRAPSTIRKALAGLRAWHRVYGFPVPDGLAALAVLSDHDTNLREAGWEPERAVPITLSTAVRLLAPIDRSTPRGKRDTALLFLAFGGMLGPHNLAKLVLRQVTYHDEGLRLHHRPGRLPLLLPHWSLAGEHHPDLCPVEGIWPWCELLAARGAPGHSPLLRAVDQWQHVAGVDDRFAGHVDPGGALAAGRFGVVLGRIADEAGLPEDQRPTMTELRLGGIVRRRRDGATVDELAAESGVASLLRYVALVERREPAPAEVDRPSGEVER